MKFEVLKKNYKKEIIVGVSVLIIIGIALLIRVTFAKYSLVKNIKIAEGTINYKMPDFKIMAMYQQKVNQTCTNDSCYEEVLSNKMPNHEYKINETKSYCSLDNINKDTSARLYTNKYGEHVISDLSKSSKCYLYFDNNMKIVSTVLGDIKVHISEPDFNRTSCSNGCEEKTVGIYMSNDNDGETYYYRGDVENNYLKFAGFYWRVIRVNGDGTVRIIYQGKTIDATGEDAQIGKSAFNPYAENNMYAGFKYTDGQVHGTSEKSIILKDSLEPWYQNNLISYASKIDINAGFCNDRTPSTSKTEINNQGGTGNTLTYYRGYHHLYSRLPVSFKCLESDLFTHKTSNKGNKSLDYPIGLITADEARYAGTTSGWVANSQMYLNTGVSYWTMTPMYYFYDGAYNAVGFVQFHSSGNLYGTLVPNQHGVRPVINIKSDVSITGTGTISDPYIVS